LATLEEQLESALEGTQSAMSASDIGEMLSGTATSIQPGTITPITSQQSNQLSWKNVFEKISEGIELQPGEGLPEVPKNIPASTFYRTATQAGALPAGGSQFFTQPLAPETPAMETGVTETTEPETTVTSGTQNVARQVQESFDLHEGSGTDVDFYEDPFALHAEQTRIEQTLALGRDPNAIGIERVKNDMALLGSAVGKRAGDPKTLLGLALPMELSIPLTILQGVFSEGHGQIGLSGLVSDDYWSPMGKDMVETPTQVYGFASIPGSPFSFAVDKFGRQVVQGGYNKGLGIYGFGSTDKGQMAYDVRNETYADYANKAKQEYEERLAAGLLSEKEGEFTTVEEQAQLETMSREQALSDYAQGLIGPDPSAIGEGGYAETGEDPHGDKIICTMMNRMYGLGNYRAKQWLLYSNRYLTPEHQLGYHKLYYKLVSMMPSNKLIAKVLSHIANKRTDDIVAEMKGMKRSWLGRIYRATLIDTPSYVVGLMIKRNWLKPADISILN
jgi:hypothetical protein